MSCRRICRELLWLSRFGELGPSSAPHLEHLSTCRGCRDEVGFDRAMVQQLRIALQARIGAEAPSSNAWQTILERARQPEPPPSVRLWEWSTALVGRLRTATAMAGTGLALVLALNMEVIHVHEQPREAPAADEIGLQQVPRAPTGRTMLEADAHLPRTPERPADPETVMTRVGARVGASPAIATPAPEAEESEEAPSSEVRVVFRQHQSPDPTIARGSGASSSVPPGVTTIRVQPGEPS